MRSAEARRRGLALERRYTRPLAPRVARRAVPPELDHRVVRLAAEVDCPWERSFDLFPFGRVVRPRRPARDALVRRRDELIPIGGEGHRAEVLAIAHELQLRGSCWRRLRVLLVATHHMPPPSLRAVFGGEALRLDSHVERLPFGLRVRPQLERIPNLEHLIARRGGHQAAARSGQRGATDIAPSVRHRLRHQLERLCVSRAPHFASAAPLPVCARLRVEAGLLVHREDPVLLLPLRRDEGAPLPHADRAVRPAGADDARAIPREAHQLDADLVADLVRALPLGPQLERAIAVGGARRDATRRVALPAWERAVERERGRLHERG
mmetsp:Transcript_49822/g.123834  ORF Transcript_49822/g.123834 Transcript_49822/m.123834 type:complete len:324 (-) Transcript_49822:183-1154(-)